MYVPFSVFCVLFVCKYVLYCCVNPTAIKYVHHIISTAWRGRRQEQQDRQYTQYDVILWCVRVTRAAMETPQCFPFLVVDLHISVNNITPLSVAMVTQ
jgi:hypothetical protein